MNESAQLRKKKIDAKKQETKHGLQNNNMKKKKWYIYSLISETKTCHEFYH